MRIYVVRCVHEDPPRVDAWYTWMIGLVNVSLWMK
jgi:hypothetical protein